MLTLLKQARAFGLGVVLATQNPVDLDYKGLANIGTWFLGRLQTARDRDRLLAGLTSSSSRAGFDRLRVEEILASLGKRRFLVRNVHEDAPVVFQTRWAMSYLRGPLTLAQIRALTGPAEASREPEPPAPLARSSSAVGMRPVLPSGISECFERVSATSKVYEPGLLASVVLRYVKSSYGLDVFETVHFLTPLDEEADTPDWAAGRERGEALVEEEPEGAIRAGRNPSCHTSIGSVR